MTPSTLHDDELEHRLRGLLDERAATITGDPPPLSAPRFVAAPTGAGRSVTGGRRAVLGIAAAVVLVAAGLAAARAFAPGSSSIRTGAEPGRSEPTPTTAAPSEPAADAHPASAELPAWLALRTATPVFEGQGGAEEVARAYLTDRFGDDVPEAEAGVASDLVFTPAASPEESITALRFDQDGDGLESLPQGTVFLRQDGQGWVVVASATDGLSLASVRREAGRITGRAVGDPSYPVADELHTIVSAPTEDPGPLEGGAAVDVEVGQDTVVVRTTFSGGRTLGITEFMSDPAPDPDLKVLWSGSDGDRAQRQDPESTARAFAASTATPLPVVAADLVAPSGDPTGTGVRLTLEGGLTVTVDLARSDDGWVVTTLRDDTGLDRSASAESTGPDQTLLRSIRTAVPDSVVSADVTVWADGEPTTRTIEGAALDAGPDDMHVELEGTNTALITFDPPAAVHHTLLVGRDAAGTVVTVQAGAWA